MREELKNRTIFKKIYVFLEKNKVPKFEGFFRYFLKQMDTKDKELKEQIKESLYRHGKLSLLFYKTMDEWIVRKCGDFERLSNIQQLLFEKYRKAGLIEEAESLTLMELPNDVDLIFKILTCGSIKKILKEIGHIES